MGMAAVLRGARRQWLWALLPIGLLGALYYDGLAYMVHKWVADENYGHGFFVPLISGYLIWQRRQRLREMHLAGSWWGVPVILAGLGLYFVGTLATLYVLIHLSFWLVLVGLLLAFIGMRGVGAIAFPLFYLLTVIPLPDFLQQGLTGKLQLISSQFGVGCLQLAGVMAYREGNVIDLGPIQLQVVEACSGLRYLFPLAWLALLFAYLFQDRMWKRVVLFLSSFPIAIFLNGFRIGITGILVDRYGVWVAEGFFHSFSGWLLFVSALMLFVAEMWLLARIGNDGDRRSLSDRLWPGPAHDALLDDASARWETKRTLTMAPSYLFAIGLLAMAMIVSTQLARRAEASLPRQLFVDFPLAVGEWSGRTSVMEKEYVDSLRFDDYLLADYRRSTGGAVNLYVAYYDSQKAGRSAHSPKTCIPGGGWEITSMRSLMIDTTGPGESLTVNRAIIQKGDQKQLALYWFQQRGRVLANEYLVKFYLLWDALVRNRTDGALVRLMTPVALGESEAAAEGRLVSFARTARPLLTAYIPE
jgi:exosortase D (VPLPA-CTERM-specific)